MVLGMLAYFAITHQTRISLKVLTISVSGILILWVGASRIYLGVHWVSEVIGGYIIGLLFLFGLTQLYQGLRLRPGTRNS
jgi:undecaprenyl-diphosphatase